METAPGNATLALVSTGMTHTTLPDRWATWMTAQSWSPDTVRSRLETLTQAARHANVEPDDLDHEHLVNFLARPGLSPSSRATYHAQLAAWFRWLATAGIRDDNPLDGLRRPKARRREVKALHSAHIRHLLASGIRARTRAMVLLGAYAGFRAADIANMHGSQVDMVAGELEVTGKGGVHAVLPLHPLIAEAAADYPHDDWWFPQHIANHKSASSGPILPNSVTGTIGTAMKRAGIRGSCHSLRRWFASELLRQGNDLRVIQQLMRHSSLATTEQYLLVDSDRRRSSLLTLPDLTAPEVAMIPERQAGYVGDRAA